MPIYFCASYFALQTQFFSFAPTTMHETLTGIGARLSRIKLSEVTCKCAHAFKLNSSMWMIGSYYIHMLS